MLLQGNFATVPNVEQPLKSGLYTFIVKSCDVKDAVKDGAVVGSQVLTVLEAKSGPNGEDIGAEAGKPIFDRIDWIPAPDFTGLKRLALSSGLTDNQIAQGIDIALLPGRMVKGLVKTSVSQKDGKTYANLRDYILPGEALPRIS